MRKQWVQQGETNKSMAPSIQQLLIRDHHSTPFSAKTGGKSVARRVLQGFGGKRMQEVAGDGTRANQAAISNLDAALGTPPLGNLPSLGCAAAQIYSRKQTKARPRWRAQSSSLFLPSIYTPLLPKGTDEEQTLNLTVPSSMVLFHYLF